MPGYSPTKEERIDRLEKALRDLLITLRAISMCSNDPNFSKLLQTGINEARNILNGDS